MGKQPLSVSEQISPEDWDNTPNSVKRLVESLVANVSLSIGESRLIQFLDATPMGIAVHDSTGQLIYINNIGRSLLGNNRYLDSETDRLSAFFQIYRAGTKEPYPIQDLPSSRAFAGETVQVSDLEIHRPDRVVPLEVTAMPIFEPQGQVIYAIATFQDISDRLNNEAKRNQAEVALQESELKLRNLTDAIPGAVYQFRLSPEGGFSMPFVSQGIRELGGISPEQAINDIQGIWDLILPEDWELLQQSIAISAQTLEPWNLEFRIQTASNKIKWILGQSIPSQEENGVIIWNGILTDISDRKRSEADRQQTEEALRQSEDRFRKMAANVPGAIFRYLLRPDDGSDAVLYMSPGCYGLWEVEAEAVVQDATILWKMVHSEDRTPMYESIMQSAQTLQPWSWAWRIITPSGQQKWLEASGRPERQVNGEIIWDTLILDVSVRKQAEIELHYQKEVLQATFDHLPLMIGIYSARGEVLMMNQELERIVGWAKEEYKTVDVLKACYPNLEDYEQVINHIVTANSTWKDFKTQARDGRILDTSWAQVRLSDGRSIGIGQDITARKQVEASLRESESRYRLLAENINDLVCLHHPDGRYLYVSPSCETLLGYRYDEMLGQDPYTFFHPDDRDRIKQEAHAAAIVGNTIPITYRMHQKSGNYIWFETLTNPIMDATGQVIQLQTTSRDVTARIQVQNQLEYETLHDALTGLPNRNLLIERLELSIHRANRLDNYHFAVLFLDLDRFKVVNDSLGHLAGDKLLIAIAQKLQAALREIDLIARLGGDEFVILLDEIRDIQEAIHATERIFAQLQTPLMLEGREVYTTSSIGIVLGTKDYTQASNLLRDADIAMYRAKTNGKARYEIFDVEMHREALIRMNLENDLRQAIAHQEFILHYQPIVDLNNRLLVGFEALMRWQHPSQGLKYPGEFVAVAEEIGLITSLTSWALLTACQQLVAWQTAFPNLSKLKVSINLSAQDLRRSDLLAEVDLVLARTQLDARYLTLEITESMLIEDIESTIRLFSQLKERGIQISLDDFGTGYSSLNYLHRLPMNNLKVDRSFVNQIEEGKKNYQIVKTIATLSKQLELEAIAEGIETTQQMERLQELGYRFGQGYLFSKPLSPQAVEVLLAKA